VQHLIVHRLVYGSCTYLGATHHAMAPNSHLGFSEGVGRSREMSVRISAEFDLLSVHYI
jgi:hypothetical protein